MFHRLPFEIVLASGSPRRAQLLKECGFQFEVQVFEVDESIDPSWPIIKAPELLALKKAKEAFRQIPSASEKLIIAADTMVILNDTPLNKPADLHEAQQMLKAISGQTHLVVTGVALEGVHELTFHDVTEVQFDHLSDREIDYYLHQYKPFDKAGAYGIQQWIGHNKIKSIQGSYTNVMGLPTAKLFQAFRLIIGDFI
jgi:septum formation protein